MAKGTLADLSARKRYFLIKKLRKLRDKLSMLINRLKLVGVAAGVAGMTMMGTEADAQHAGVGIPLNVTLDDHLLNDTYTGDQKHPAVALSDEGDVISVWQDGYNITGKKISADGTESAEFVVFESPDGTSVSSPEIDINANGDFAVIWEQGEGEDLTIQVEKFDGESLVGEGEHMLYDLDDNTSEADQILSIALNEQGDIAVTFVERANGEYYSGQNFKFSNANFDASATYPLNGSTVDDYESGGLSLAMNSDGESVVVWHTNEYFDGYGYASSVWYQKFDEVGNSVGNGEVIFAGYADEGGTASMLDPAVGLADNGEFVISWTDETMYDATVYAQKFNAAGESITSKSQVFYGSNGYSPKSAISMDSNGSFVVSFDSERYGNLYLESKRFDRFAGPIDSFFHESIPLSGRSVSDMDIDMNSKGEFAVVWVG